MTPTLASSKAEVGPHTGRCTELNDVQLGIEDPVGEGLLSKADDDALLIRSSGSERGKCSSVRLKSLAALLLDGIQLHEALHELWPAKAMQDVLVACSANESLRM